MGSAGKSPRIDLRTPPASAASRLRQPLSVAKWIACSAPHAMTAPRRRGDRTVAALSRRRHNTCPTPRHHRHPGHAPNCTPSRTQSATQPTTRRDHTPPFKVPQVTKADVSPSPHCSTPQTPHTSCILGTRYRGRGIRVQEVCGLWVARNDEVWSPLAPSPSGLCGALGGLQGVPYPTGRVWVRARSRKGLTGAVAGFWVTSALVVPTV